MRTALAVVLAFLTVAAAGEEIVPQKFVCRYPLSLPTPPPPCLTPATVWDKPSCDDERFDAALIESAASGDRSAIELLQRRYAAAATHAERIAIGAALLGRVRDDDAIWKDLAGWAEHAVEFHFDPDAAAEKLAAYCKQHDCAPDDYDRLSWQALDAISGDRRARPLLLRALTAIDTDVVNEGIGGLAAQHDETSLPEIEKALQRLPEAASMLALALVDFQSDAADKIAIKYLADDDREAYAEERQPPGGGTGSVR